MPWDHALRFYQRLVEMDVAGGSFVPFRDLVAAMTASPLSGDLYIYPGTLLTYIASFHEPGWWAKCPRAEVSWVGWGPEARLRIRYFDAEGTAPASVRECHPGEGVEVIGGLFHRREAR